jgi:hypothetical protein
MDQKDVVNSCIELAEFSARRVDARRTYEWKVTFGVWTLIAVSAAFSYGKSFPVHWSVIPILTILQCIWVRGVFTGNQNDRMMAYHFRSQAELCLRDKNRQVDSTPRLISYPHWKWWFGFVTNWGTLFQVLATLVLTIAAYFVSHSGQEVQPVCKLK